MRTIIAIVLLLTSSLFCYSAGAAGLPGVERGVKADVAKQIETAWDRLEPDNKGRTFYICRVSPPFPLDGEKIYYVYAVGLGEVSDGEMVKGIWGRVVEKGNEQRFEQTISSFDKIKDLGVQGVHPVRTKTVKEAKTGPCDWIKANKVISDEIIPMHKGYFSSLKCS